MYRTYINDKEIKTMKAINYGVFRGDQVQDSIKNLREKLDTRAQLDAVEYEQLKQLVDLADAAKVINPETWYRWPRY